MLAKTITFPDYPTAVKSLKLTPSNKKFVFDDTGITWQFDEYEMGSYADGPKAGCLTYKKLMSVATNDSIVSKLVAGN
jgi:hypothetical protein